MDSLETQNKNEGKIQSNLMPLHEFGESWAKIFEKPKQKEEENVNSRSAKNENERLKVAEQADSPTDTDGR